MVVNRILLDSTHFQEIRAGIRSRTMAWDALSRSPDMNQEDVLVARRVDEALLGSNNELVVSDSVLSSLVRFLGVPTNNEESRKYTMNLVAELLSSNEYAGDVVRYFEGDPQKLQQLFDISLQGDSQTVLISSFVIVSLLIQEGVYNKELVNKLLQNANFVNLLTSVGQADTLYVCIRLLQELATVKKYRATIWENRSSYLPTVFRITNNSINRTTMPTAHNNGGVAIVVTNSNNLGIQLQYYSLLLIWLLTFNTNIACDFTKQYLPEFLKLLQLVKITIKEKISRLSIAIILQCCSTRVRNYKNTVKNLLLLGNTLPILHSLNERKYSDEELNNDIVTLTGLLEAEYKELTSFDEYQAELDSKLLCWSPPHVDNGFWSENIDKFKLDNWKLFKQLISILLETAQSIHSSKMNELDTKQKRLIIEVALSDITHVVELLPESVDVLSRLNGKVVIMELLNHSDSRVKYEALKATQAIIGYTLK